MTHGGLGSADQAGADRAGKWVSTSPQILEVMNSSGYLKVQRTFPHTGALALTRLLQDR